MYVVVIAWLYVVLMASVAEAVNSTGTVMRWRFVPGKRNGVPEAMWNLVPINFVLE